MECNHNDCFTCPYPDCILPEVKLTPIKELRHRKSFYEEHKDVMIARQLDYYYRNREERLAYQAEYEKRDYVRARKREYDRTYRAKHRAELNAKAKAKYHEKKGEKCAAELKKEP